MAKVILFYADWCGFCSEFKKDGGSWEKIKTELKNRGIDQIHEINVDSSKSNLLELYDGGGIPKVAVVQPSGDIKWHVGYTDKPDVILNMLPSSATRGSGKRRSCTKHGRRSARSKQAAEHTFCLHDLLWHVMEHCKHVTCKKDPIKALQCSKTCCIN